MPVGVSATAEEALMKDSDFGSYKLEGNVPGERLGPIIPPLPPPPPKSLPGCICGVGLRINDP